MDAIDMWIAESISYSHSIVTLPLEQALEVAPLAKAKAIDLGRVLMRRAESATRRECSAPHNRWLQRYATERRSRMPIPTNPLVNPDDFNRVVIAGVVSPGVCTVQGATRTYNWDVRHSPGLQGAHIMYWGWKVSEDIKIEFRFWEAKQIAEFFGTFLPKISIDATKKTPVGLSIYHPVLAANNITSVATKQIGDLVDLGSQMWSVTITFLEFRKPTVPRYRGTVPVVPGLINQDPTGRTALTGIGVLDAIEHKYPRYEDTQDEMIAGLVETADFPLGGFARP